MNTLIDLCIDLSLVIAFTFIYGLMKRRLRPTNKIVAQIFDGIAFAGIALVGMLIPIELMPGVIMDERVIVTALAAIFSGPVASIITAASTSVYRFTLGGLGVWPGIAAIFMGVVTGLLFRRLVKKPPVKLTIWHFVILGSINAVIGLICTLFVPNWEIASKAFVKYLIPVNVFYPVSAGLLGYLLVRELRNIETESELSKWALAFENADWGIAIGKGDTLVALNASYAKMHGYDVEELIGKPIADVLAPDQIETAREHIRMSNEGRRESFEILHRRRDGTTFPAYVDVVSAVDIRGDRYRIVNVQDVTHRKELEEQLLQAEKMNAIGQLAGGIAHDFNNQLGGILGFAEMINEATEEERTKRYSERILAGASRAADLTRQLLSFARKGKRKILRVDLNEVAEEVVGIIRRSIDRKINIKTDLHSDGLVIDGDPSQIQNAVLNLAINAGDSMPDGGLLTISTSRSVIEEQAFDAQGRILNPGNYCRVVVTDTGSGIPEDIRHRIFEPFFTTKEDGKGVGMGLAAVYGAVMEHNGAVDVTSVPGRGSSFTLLFPPATLPQSEVESNPSALPSGSYTILVVDDEPDMRKMLIETLTKNNHRTIECTNGRHAIDIYREKVTEIDLIILDMIMPELGGYETYLAVREINPTAKVLLSSGYSLQSEARKLLNLGVTGLLEKPYRKNELLHAIWSAMEE